MAVYLPEKPKISPKYKPLKIFPLKSFPHDLFFKLPIVFTCFINSYVGQAPQVCGF